MAERRRAPFPTITHQEVREHYREDGQAHKHWRVHLHHHDDTHSYVDVPDEQYTAENVHALAQDEADRVMAVRELPVEATQAV